jgi:hypothetical protein
MENRLFEVNNLANQSQIRLNDTNQVLKSLEERLRTTEVCFVQVFYLQVSDGFGLTKRDNYFRFNFDHFFSPLVQVKYCVQIRETLYSLTNAGVSLLYILNTEREKIVLKSFLQTFSINIERKPGLVDSKLDSRWRGCGFESCLILH